MSGTSGREVCSVEAIARSITRGLCTHIPPICKVADSKRVLFALSLLDTLLEEFSISLIKHLTPLQQSYDRAGSTTASTTTPLTTATSSLTATTSSLTTATSSLTAATSSLTTTTSSLTSTPSSPTTATSSSLGMLELLVRVCVELLRADYCRHVLSSMEDDVQLLRIKGAVCHVLDKLLKVFISVPDGTRAGTIMLTRNYFISLLTLCEVQPTLLSFVVQWVDCCCRRGLVSSTDPEFSLDSSLCLLLPILNVIHCLAQLEVGHDGPSNAQFSLSELTDADCFSAYTPGTPVLKQKLFWILILSMLKHSKNPTTSCKLPAAVCCLLLSLLNVIQDILTSVLPEILTCIAEILSSALLPSNAITSSNVTSLDKVTILSLIPGYYGAGLFQEFGCEIVADCHSCIFRDAYISQWRNHLVLLKEEAKNLTRLSPNLDSGEEQKGRLSWMFGSLFSRATTTAQTQGVVKTVTGTPNAVIKITPNVSIQQLHTQVQYVQYLLYIQYLQYVQCSFVRTYVYACKCVLAYIQFLLTGSDETCNALAQCHAILYMYRMYLCIYIQHVYTCTHVRAHTRTHARMHAHTDIYFCFNFESLLVMLLLDAGIHCCYLELFPSKLFKELTK